MKKLKLDVGDLTVESFEAAGGTSPKGTARAHEATDLIGCSELVNCASADTNCAELCFPGTAGTGAAYTCDSNCTYADGYTCAAYNTCASPCRVSDATNCHRCTANQTDPYYC
ncbi:MAG TPA: hypothetical protein VFJ16_09740 [Longimicrobium sp.]|nr:hypothetical protein [Longimicrobium sp.]